MLNCQATNAGCLYCHACIKNPGEWLAAGHISQVTSYHVHCLHTISPGLLQFNTSFLMSDWQCHFTRYIETGPLRTQYYWYNAPIVNAAFLWRIVICTDTCHRSHTTSVIWWYIGMCHSLMHEGCMCLHG